MSLDESILTQMRDEVFSGVRKQAKEAAERLKKEFGDKADYPSFPVFDENEVKEAAIEFERVFKAKRKSEALSYFRELPEHCKKYIMETNPYRNYWRASRLSF